MHAADRVQGVNSREGTAADLVDLRIFDQDFDFVGKLHRVVDNYNPVRGIGYYNRGVGHLVSANLYCQTHDASIPNSFQEIWEFSLSGGIHVVSIEIGTDEPDGS